MFRPIHFLLLCCFTIHVKAQETQLNKGIRAYEIQDYDRAIEQLDSALLLCTSCHDSILAKIEMYRGKYFQYIGRHERAYPAYENGMQYARKSGSQNIKFWANVCLAEFMRSREKLDSAMVLLDGIKEQIKDPAVSLANKGYYYNRLGAILLETKSSPQKLKEVSDNALSIFSELKDTLSMASTLNVLGRYFEDANLLTEAESTYERAVQLLSETENKRDFVDVIINYSSTCRKLGKYNKSIDLANKGLSLCDSSAAWHEPLYYLYIERAISYEQLGDMRQAFDNISLGYKHSVKYLSQRYNDQIARVSKQLDLRNKEIALQDERLAKQQVEANLLAEQKSKNTFRAMLGI
ncbi:MAG: tetratricopeptide repeat protein, partial [Luteibaculum sp.]